MAHRLKPHSSAPSSALPTFVPPVPLAGPAFDRGLLTPYVQQYNVSLETALNNNVTLQAAYVGANGRKFVSHGGYRSIPACESATPCDERCYRAGV